MQPVRNTIVFILGLALCAGIWLAVPYNNFALNNSFVSDGYLPEIVLLCVVLLVLVVNPMLRRFLPGAALSHSRSGSPSSQPVCSRRTPFITSPHSSPPAITTRGPAL